MPPAFASWRELAEFTVWARDGGALSEANQQWWDLRLAPTHGTIELRVADTQTRVDDAATLIALVQSLVADLANRHEAGEELPVHRDERIVENMWLATRDGIGGHLLDLDTGAKLWTADRLQDLAARLVPTATQLGCDRELAGIGRLVLDGGGAARQRGIVRRRGLESLLPKLAEETSGLTAEEAEERLLGHVPTRERTAPGSRLRRWPSPGVVPSPRCSQRPPVARAPSRQRSPREAPTATIDVTARDYGFKLSAKTAPPARSRSSSRTPAADHSFQIAGKKTAGRQAGQDRELVVTFTKTGPFAYTSTVAGDAAKGMKGTLTVKAAAALARARLAAGKDGLRVDGLRRPATRSRRRLDRHSGPNLDRSTVPLATILARVAGGKGAMQAYAGTLTSSRSRTWRSSFSCHAPVSR